MSRNDITEIPGKYDRAIRVCLFKSKFKIVYSYVDVLLRYWLSDTELFIIDLHSLWLHDISDWPADLSHQSLLLSPFTYKQSNPPSVKGYDVCAYRNI